MKKTLKKLTLLQEIDTKIHALVSRRDEIPRQIEEQVQTLGRAQRRQHDLEEHALEQRKAVDARTLELRRCEEKVYQKDVQLNTISTNDAYKAMLREIEGLKADRSRIEDTILELSYAQDEMAERIAGARKDVDAARKEHDLRQAELGQQSGLIEQEIDTLRAQRGTHLEGVDRDTLAAYDRILGHRGGRALAVVRDRHCQGCQMQLTLQEVNLLMGAKELLTCRTCSRILYMDEVLDGVDG